MYSVYLRRHDGSLGEKTRTGTPDAALAAFRDLLDRRDLDGEPIAAVLRDQLHGRTLLFSRFDMPQQRLLPTDWIDMDALDGASADNATCAIVTARTAAPRSDDAAELVARAKKDWAMIRDFGRPGTPLTDAELAVALGFRGAGGRNTVKRLAEGKGTDTTRMLLMALLDGWRPKGHVR